ATGPGRTPASGLAVPRDRLPRMAADRDGASRPSLVATAGSLDELAQAASLAEQAGFESVWSTEFYDRSATISMAAMAQPTAPVAAPPREDLPIYMAGVNPRMVQAAGTVGDGLVGHPLFTPEYVRDVVRPALAKGAERAGRSDPVPIAGYLTCSVDDDR